MSTVRLLNDISTNITFNTFGGVKATIGELQVDVWCEELSHFLCNTTKADYIYNMKRSIIMLVFK